MTDADAYMIVLCETGVPSDPVTLRRAARVTADLGVAHHTAELARLDRWGVGETPARRWAEHKLAIYRAALRHLTATQAATRPVPAP